MQASQVSTTVTHSTSGGFLPFINTHFSKEKRVLALKIAAVALVVIALTAVSVASIAAASTGGYVLPLFWRNITGSMYGIGAVYGVSALMAIPIAIVTRMFTYTEKNLDDCKKFLSYQTAITVGTLAITILGIGLSLYYIPQPFSRVTLGPRLGPFIFHPYRW